MIALVWGAIALVFVLRAVAAFGVPLTGDEAYYWEWSRRLAFGYVDHPPAVAWTIAAFAPFGHNPGLVRLGFVVCGVVATLAVAACAGEVTHDRRAGAAAGLALALAPLASLAFGSASPDGPYLMCWALAIWLAVRAFRDDRARDWVLLGLALAGVLYSRVLGFALPFGLMAYSLGPRRRHLWRRGMPLTLATALIALAPFLAWNAAHDWVTLSFALLHRHEETHHFSFARALALYGTQAAAYSPGIFAAVLVCAFRPRNALLAWTALPQLGLVTVLAFFEQVEIHWIFGTFVSLCAMAGIAYAGLAPRARSVWAAVTVVPASLLLALLFTFSFAPLDSYRVVQRATGLALSDGGPFEVLTYGSLAQDAARLARERDAVVMTDGYGFSSVLDFDGGIPPVVIGYDWQGRESRTWYPSSMHPPRALFVDKVPLETRPDFADRLARACAHVADGGVHTYAYGGTVPRRFYFTWCDGLVPGGLAILRWEQPA